MFPYNKIFKRAWELVKTERFLSLFGLFLILWLVGLFWILSDSSALNQYDIRIMGNRMWFAGLFFLLFAILYFRMKAGLLVAIKALIDKQPTSFGTAFKAGSLFYGRILGASLLLLLSASILILVVLGPVTYISGANGAILGISGMAILIPVIVMIILIRILAPLFVVVYDQKIGEAIDRSYGLIARFWPRILFFGLVLLILEIVPLFLSVFMVGLLGGIWYKAVVATALVVVLTPIAVFQHAAWVLMFLDLVRPQKMDPEEAVPAPEIAS